MKEVTVVGEGPTEQPFVVLRSTEGAEQDRTRRVDTVIELERLWWRTLSAQ